jgi:hypothetical protein
MLLAFKMGVKIFCTATIFWISPRTFFVAPRYFCSSPPLHDRLISTETPSFPRLRQDSLFLPRRLLLLCHDIFVFSAMPFFVAPQNFYFHRAALLLLHHDIFDCTEMPFFCPFTILSKLHELLLLAKR